MIAYLFSLLLSALNPTPAPAPAPAPHKGEVSQPDKGSNDGEKTIIIEDIYIR